MQIVPIELSTLTPLWSGGVNRDCDRLHETSLLSSMRWWYEILVRSLGGNVCDITSDGRCNYEKNKICCEVCKIFGCTGLSRQFSLRVQENQLSKTPKFFIPSGRCHKFKRRGKEETRAGGWHLPEGFWGNFSLDFASSNSDCLAVLNVLFLMHHHVGFTAKANTGYGIFEINNLTTVKQSTQQIKNLNQPKTNTYPILQNMFFLKVQIPKPNLRNQEEIKLLETGEVTWKDCKAKIKEGWTELKKHLEDEDSLFLPTAPIIKNRLRKHKKNGNRIFDRDDILGTVKRKAIASKVNISNLYQKNGNWEFRVWGWLKDNNLLNELHEFFYSEIPNIFGFDPNDVQIQWREFNSSRDTVLKNELNFENYLGSLLNG